MGKTMTSPDLHLHSTFSDGVLSPEQLVGAAQQAGVTVMAITDHDTFGGSDSLHGAELPVRVIPGVELSIADMQGLHLLGYGLGAGTALRETVLQLAEKRVDRAKKMLERLRSLSVPLEWEMLEHKYHGTVGRPHIARALVHEGYVNSMQEAFERYLGSGKPAYVPGERLTMREALTLMRSSGYVPVLAHPYELRVEDTALTALLNAWKDQGLMGVEVYHPSAFSHGFDQLERMTRRMGLLVTGGSDFHQENDRHGRIGCTMQDWIRAEADIDDLMTALEQTKNEA